MPPLMDAKDADTITETNNVLQGKNKGVMGNH